MPSSRSLAISIRLLLVASVWAYRTPPTPCDLWCEIDLGWHAATLIRRLGQDVIQRQDCAGDCHEGLPIIIKDTSSCYIYQELAAAQEDSVARIRIHHDDGHDIDEGLVDSILLLDGIGRFQASTFLVSTESYWSKVFTEGRRHSVCHSSKV